jgi:uncharacterized protein YkwD
MGRGPAWGGGRRRIGVAPAAVALVVVGVACAPAPPSPPAPGVSCGLDPTDAALLADANASRAAVSEGGLAANGQLDCLAQAWSQYLAVNHLFQHRDLNAVIRSPGFGGYHTLGENLLVGPNTLTAAAMHAAWMNSPEHRANILSNAFTSVGIGVAYGSDGQVYAVEDFGG